MMLIPLLAPQQMWIQNLPSPYSKNKRKVKTLEVFKDVEDLVWLAGSL